MGMDWNLEKELAYFDSVWNYRSHSQVDHSSEAWDARAECWKREFRSDTARAARRTARVQFMADFLRRNGLLKAEQAVLDVGAGPGVFAAEFARTAKEVTAWDISPRMSQCTLEHAAQLGLTNVSTITCDFKKADVNAMGLKEAFDVVFACTTPAANDPMGLEKLEQLSCGYCCNCVFVRAYDPLEEIVRVNVCPEASTNLRWDGRAFYAMFNLHWLRGRYPIVDYYCDEKLERLPADERLARKLFSRLTYPGQESIDIQKIVSYLQTLTDKDGMINYHTKWWYGCLLWDVRDNYPRNYSQPDKN